MKPTLLDAELEIDHARGVIYVHLVRDEDIAERGVHTALRICGLPTPIPQIQEGRELDLTIAGSAAKLNWRKT